MVFQDTTMFKVLKKKRKKKSINIYKIYSIHEVALSAANDITGENGAPFRYKPTASLSNNKKVNHIRL